MSTKPEIFKRKAVEGIKSEIMAGSVLFPKNEGDKAWNNANKRAVSIINKYLAGEGLFMLDDK